MRLQASLLTICVLTAGCSGSSGPIAQPPIPQPSHQPATPGHIYIARLQATVDAYVLPLTTSSKPAFSFPVPGLSGVERFDCSDNQGRLFVNSATSTNNTLVVYTQPITAVSVPSFSLPTKYAPYACAADNAGDLYVLESLIFGFQTSIYLEVFQAPVHAGSMSLRANLIAHYMPDSGPAFPGTTTDSLGDVFVSGATPLTGPWPILEFSALASGNLQTASFGSDASGVAIGPDGNLYVPNFNALIDVYLPSAFHNGGTKDHSIALPSGIAPGAIAFDSTHTLLVIGAKGSVLPTLYLLSLPPPYSVVSTMVQIASDSSSIAIAP